jgi:hypothetical protein
MQANNKTPEQLLDESMQLHLHLVAEGAQRLIDQIDRKQASQSPGLRKRFPCFACKGEGILETFTVYAPITRGAPKSIKRPGDGRDFGTVGAARCFCCEGTGVDLQEAGREKMSAVLKLVGGAK